MKTLNKVAYVCTVTAMLIFSSASFAAGDSGKQVISKIQVSQSGRVLIWGVDGSWNNPDTCDSSKYIALLPEQGAVVNEYYSEMYALLVAGYLQGKTVSGRLDGCISVVGTTYPILTNVYSY